MPRGYKPKPISCSLGIFRLSESDWAKLATEFPSYIGQSKNLPERWRTYVESATDFKKHKNCLDRLNLKGNRVLFRLLDWGISSPESLDACERCQIALWKPHLNRVTYDYDESYCQVPIARSRGKKQPSGIYQLVVVPLGILKSITYKEVAVRDVIHHLNIDLMANPERLKGYVPLRRLKFYDF